MDYSDFYSILLTEGSLEYVTKLLTNKKVERYLPRILELDPSKNFIVRLAQFFLENPEEPHFIDVSNTFQTYLTQKKNQWWKGEPSDKNDIKKFSTYEEFATAVGNVEAKYGALKKVGKLEFYDKFVQLDPSKKHVVKLIEFFVENPTNQQFDLIKADYEAYIKQQQNGWWADEESSKNNINKFDEFEEFSSTVHKIESEKNPDHGTCGVSDRGAKLFVFGKYIDKNDVTYQSDDVIVVHAPNMTKSKQYGDGFSTWCTARESNNYFYSYRFGTIGGIGDSSLYYVYFPNRCKINQNDNTTVIHFGVNAAGDISYTDRGNEEYTYNLDWLKQKFPEFKDVDMGKVFKHFPPSETEKRASQLADEISDNQFITLPEDEKIIYLSTGERDVNLTKFESMSPIIQDAWLKACDANKSLFKLEIIQKYPNHKYVKKFFKWMQTANQYEFTSILSDFISNNSDIRISDILTFFTQHGIVESRILSTDTIRTLIRYAENKIEMINFILSKNIPLDEDVIGTILDWIPDSDKDNIILTILNKNIELNDTIIYQCLENAKNKDKIISVLLTKNINFSDNIAGYFILFAQNKKKMLAILLKKENINVKSLWNLAVCRDILIRKINPRRLILYLIQKGLKPDEIFISDAIDNFLNFHSDNFQTIIDLLTHYKVPLDSIFTGNIIDRVLSRSKDPQKIINRLLDKQYPLKANTIQWLVYYSIDDKTKLETIYKIIQSPVIELSYEVIYAILSNVSDETVTPVVDQMLKKKLDIDAGSTVRFFKKATDRGYDKKKLIKQLIAHNAPFNEAIARMFLMSGGEIDMVLEHCTRRGINITEVFDDSLIESLISQYSSEFVMSMIIRYKITITHNRILLLLSHASNISVILQQLQSKGYDINHIFSPLVICQLVSSFSASARIGRGKIIQFIIDMEIPLNAECVNCIVEYSPTVNKKEIIYKLIERPNTTITEDIIGTMFKYLPAPDRKTFFINLMQKGIYKFTGSSKSREIFAQIAFDGANSMMEVIRVLLTKGEAIENIIDPNNLAVILFRIYASKHNSLEVTNFIVFLIENKLPLTESMVLQFFKHGDPFYTFETIFNKKLIPLDSLLYPSNIAEIMAKDGDPVKLPKLFVENQLPITEKIMGYFMRHSSDQLSTLRVVTKYINLNYTMINTILSYWDGVFGATLIKELLMNGNVELTEEITSMLVTYLYDMSSASADTVMMTEVINILLQRHAPVNTRESTRKILKTLKNPELQNATIKYLVTHYPLTVDMVRSIMDYAPNFKEALTYFLSKNISINHIVDHLSIMSGLSRIAETERQSTIDLLLDNNIELTNQIIQILNQFATNKEQTMQKIETLKAAQMAKKAQIQESDIAYGDFYTSLLLKESIFLFEGRKMVQSTSLTPTIINKILDIEKRAYPRYMQFMNMSVEKDDDGNVIYPTVDVIANYMECDPHEMFVYVGTNWFILACNRASEVEIVDWASIGGMTVNAVNAFLSILSQFKNKIISANCRETTSYMFIKKCESKGYIEILEDSPNRWGDEMMHEVKFKVKHEAPI